jgi:hypothetical protein
MENIVGELMIKANLYNKTRQTSRFFGKEKKNRAAVSHDYFINTKVVKSTHEEIPPSYGN